MKARQAKKIIGRQWHRVPPYWNRRILDLLIDDRLDHRVIKAMRVMERKKTRGARLSPSGDSEKG